MVIELPYPPSTNRLTRNLRGRSVTSEEARNYKQAVGYICNLAQLQPLAGVVAVEMVVRRPRKVRDIDNCIKCVLDSLQGYAYANDKQVMQLHVNMVDDKRNPGITVTVKETT